MLVYDPLSNKECVVQIQRLTRCT